jgi:hypothetical protein
MRHKGKSRPGMQPGLSIPVAAERLKNPVHEVGYVFEFIDSTFFQLLRLMPLTYGCTCINQTTQKITDTGTLSSTVYLIVAS